MPIDLVTGVPGAGKTLYAVGVKLQKRAQEKLPVGGKEVPRRLMIGGVRDLLLEHEPVEMPEVQPTDDDLYELVERKPGTPPVAWVRLEAVPELAEKGREVKRYRACNEGDEGAEPLPVSAVNWWCWCLPGDVIALDECQRLFRPMPAGRKLPRYISYLETHRHYGIDLLLITQHPQLLHVNVRNLVGSHEHVRRMFGRGSTVVYQWDHCTNPDRVASAVKKVWRHPKRAYRLYKSAEIHTKTAHRLPMAMWVGLGAFAFAGYLGWGFYNKGGIISDMAAAGPAGAASSPAGRASGPGGVNPTLARSAPPPLPVEPMPPLPAYMAEPVRVDREPYAGRAVVLEGTMQHGTTYRAWFGLWQDGRRMATVDLVQLGRMGYAWQDLGGCSGVLRFGALERVVSCAPAAPRPDAPPAGPGEPGRPSPPPPPPPPANVTS